MEIFGSNDVSSLSIKGRNRIHVVRVQQLLQETTEFLAAYSRLDATTRQRIVDDAEIRMVMHVHQKKKKSRELLCIRWRRFAYSYGRIANMQAIAFLSGG